jgi:FdhD protein
MASSPHTGPAASHEPVRRVEVWRHPAHVPEQDVVAAEAPLEVRLHGQPFAVIMRTPGADRDLAAGFLLTEGVLRHAADIVRIEEVHDAGDVVNVELSCAREAAVAAAVGERRQVAMTSSCGLCGRRSLESLQVALPCCPVEWAVDVSIVTALPAALRRVQPAFEQTGGLHAAGLFDRHGHLEASAEDVGRHNAVDKVLGRMLIAGRLPLRDGLLMVSGRSSFEILQKAWYGGIPLVAAVSAPSSLAVEIAQEAGITLLGFVRDGQFNVYAHRARITTP